MNLPLLIDCPACQHNISIQADVCPQCGAPNDWLHPKLEAMSGIDSFNTSHAFSWEAKGTRLFCESSYHTASSWAMLLFIALIALSSFMFSGFIGPIFGGIFVVFFWRMSARVETLEVDLMTQEWHSENPKFWFPLLDYLELPYSDDHVMEEDDPFRKLPRWQQIVIFCVLFALVFGLKEWLTK